MNHIGSRIRKLEAIYKTRLNREADDQSSQHDSVTGDDLLRMWEGGADDWVQDPLGQVIENCTTISPDARAHLQDRLKILKVGSPQEILAVLTGLSCDCPQWCSPREGSVIEAALYGDPALARAAAECRIVGAGRKDWRAFAAWLERRAAEQLERIPP